MNSAQLKKLMRSPSAMVRYQMTGQLPKRVRPKSPLITLLEAVNPGDRGRIGGVRIGPELGYNGSRQFQTVAQALRWIKPNEEVFDSTARQAPSFSAWKDSEGWGGACLRRGQTHLSMT